MMMKLMMKLRCSQSAFSRNGILNGTTALVKCHVFDKLILRVCLPHPVFLSDVLSDVTGVISKYRLTTCLF